MSKGLSYTVSSVSANVDEDFSVTLKFGAASAEEVVALDSFTSIIQVVFAQTFDIDVSMITVSSVEATSASAVLIASSAIGSGLSMSTAPVDEPTAVSFVIPLTGNTIVTTATVETMYSASANCTDSLTPTCSGRVCIVMSCGGGSFTPDGAYDSHWDNVKPMMSRS